MKRSAPIARRTRIRRRNPERHERRRRDRFGLQAGACRLLPCAVCGQFPAEPHHALLQAQGGRACHQAPLCRWCHRRLHEGRTMKVDLRAVAARLEAALDNLDQRLEKAFSDHLNAEQSAGLRSVIADGGPITTARAELLFRAGWRAAMATIQELGEHPGKFGR